MILIGSLAQYVFPFLTQVSVDKGIEKNDFSLIQLILLGQLMVFIGQAFITVYRNWIVINLSGEIGIEALHNFLKKIFRLPISFLESLSIGNLMERVNDIKRIDFFLTNSAVLTIFSLITILTYSSILLFYNFFIFLIHILSFIILSLWVKIFLKKRTLLDKEIFHKNSLNHTNIVQIIHGLKDIKFNTAEENKLQYWKNGYKTLNNVKLKYLFLSQFQQTALFLVSQLKTILITFLAAKLVIDGEITLGMMMSITYINGQLSIPLSQLFSFFQHFQDAKISIIRLNELEEVEDETEILSSIDAGDIMFNNVSFNYPSNKNNYALKKINAVIKKNKFTVIIGKSGSGKSTLIKLLLKYYSNYIGEITIGGKNLNLIGSKNWQDKCSFVSSDNYIFTDSLENNIVLKNDTIDYDRLIFVSKLANIYEYISSLNEKYQTIIGQNINLSDGQKQRLLIARALYKNPSYLFFDEATNSLDASNEKEIIMNLKSLTPNATIVFVSHRYSTIKMADEIIIIDNGEIIEIGTPIELINKRSVYYDLFKNQI